jgi:hypothetical protein
MVLLRIAQAIVLFAGAQGVPGLYPRKRRNLNFLQAPIQS